MDPVTVTYYTAVCALLSGLMPQAAPRWTRYMIGALVGLGAAALLPQLKSALTGG